MPEPKSSALSREQGERIDRVLKAAETADSVPRLGDLTPEFIGQGERVAGTVANFIGSWIFVAAQSIIVIGWVVFNVASGWIGKLIGNTHLGPFDPFPLPLLALVLALIAGFSAPLILLSQAKHARSIEASTQHSQRLAVLAGAQIKDMVERLVKLQKDVDSLKD